MNRKVSWSVAATLGIFSPAVWALGLGGASVESFLGQSLDVRVEVISQSSEELQSITAGLASADDFELLGLSRSAITVPLEFELVTNEARPYIHITSDLNVNEPVVQVLVEVVWANGRMLREYTLFLDPPTFESKAPPVLVKPVTQAVVETTPTVENEPAPVAIDRYTPEPEAQKPEQAEVIEPVTTSEQETAGNQESIPDQVFASQQEAPEGLPEEDVLEETLQEEADQEEVLERADVGVPADEVYGPVANGETLWGIAREFSKGSGYSVNQAMLAMQRKNPDAFMNGNINSLKRGSILRMPAADEMAELSTREALLEAMRQQEALVVANRPPVTELNTPTIADTGDYQETVNEPVPEPVMEEDLGHLEIVPAEDEKQNSLLEEQIPEQSDATDVIREELSRTEEELVNAQQENAYLNQRIQELEAEMQAQAEKALRVEDSDLASIESNLAKERAADKPEAPVAITPGGETEAWYAGKTGLIAGIAVVLIGLIVWGLRRRSMAVTEAEPAESEQSAEDQAVEIQSVPVPEISESDTVIPLNPEVDAQPTPDPVSDFGPESEPIPDVVQETDMVEDIDEDIDEDIGDLEIDDPETKLDLARAYLSLGDKEASRSMLDEVLKGGNEAQKAEARQMMDEI